MEAPSYIPIKLNKNWNHDELMFQLFLHANRSLLEGNTKETIIYDFVKNGIPKENAEIIVNGANKFKKSIFRADGRNEIIFGIFLLVIGIIFTAFAFGIAETSDANYVKVPGGAIIVGIIAVIHGGYRSIFG